MTPEELERRHLQIDQWANEAADAIIFKGSRPIGNAPTSEARLREAAIALGNQRSEAVKEIAETQAFLALVIESDFYGDERPEPKTALQREMLLAFDAQWAAMRDKAI